ncbi:MAG TPA: VOC family protein [Candidatus Limnocylindria bacterium]|nr:VOC family protein [Candidatus Limnocylindria bacterium]
MPDLDAIGLVAADMKESVRFYRLLGLDVPDPTDDHLEVSLPNGMRIMFDTVAMAQQFDPQWTRPTGHAFALAFRCASPAEVDATYMKVTKAGFHGKLAPFDAFWGQRYATVLDPDGNAADLFADLKR